MMRSDVWTWYKAALSGFAACCMLLPAGCGKKHSIVVETDPPGATVWAGQQLLGPSPQILLFLDKKPVEVRASHPSCLEAATTVDPQALPADNRVLLRLPPKPAYSLTCLSHPPGADVYLDGESRGRTPLDIKGLEQGSVELVFRAPGREQVKRGITLSGGETHLTVDVTLKSMAEPYYRQQIKENPDTLANYVDFAHLLMIERQYADAMTVLADGIRVVLRKRGDADEHRVWAEVGKIIERQYIYGEPEDLPRARAMLRDMLAGLLQEKPGGHPQLFGHYAIVLDELDQREEAGRALREGWKKFTGDKFLVQLAKRKRLPLQ